MFLHSYWQMVLSVVSVMWCKSLIGSTSQAVLFWPFSKSTVKCEACFYARALFTVLLNAMPREKSKRKVIY